jgi:hypothetical protein
MRSVWLKMTPNGAGMRSGTSIGVSLLKISRLDDASVLFRLPHDFEQAFTENAGFQLKKPKFSLTAVSHWYYLFAGFQITVSHRPSSPTWAPGYASRTGRRVEWMPASNEGPKAERRNEIEEVFE